MRRCEINLSLAALQAALGGDVAYVTARLANGDPLPDWLKFDPATGTFAGLPPDNAVASIEPVAGGQHRRHRQRLTELRISASRA